MKKNAIWVMLTIATLFVACDTTPKFTIEGRITGADSLTLYLENITNTMPVVVDSAKLTEEGTYKMSHTVPAEAQFYRLRLGFNTINLVVDSAIQLVCNSNAEGFGTQYTIEGSNACETMREVALASARLKGVVNSAMNNTSMRLVALDSIAAYKERMTRLILQDPASPVAYYILMQRINGLPIYDTFDYNDNRIIAAAATAHETYLPESPRTKVLVNNALQGMAARRQEQNSVEVEAEAINYVDVELYDIAGNLRTLSQVAAQNRVVLLDFTAYQLEYSPAYNMELLELYNRYHNKGLDIYQVSFDTDLNRWQTVADNLPWVCVNDADNVYSNLVTLYDVQSLPTCYVLIDNGSQLLRPANVEELKDQVAKVLGR